MKKLIFSIITIAIAGVVAVAPVFADGGKCTLTSVLSNAYCKSDGTFIKELPKTDSDGNKVSELGDGEAYCFCSSDIINGKNNAEKNPNAITDILKMVVNILSIGVGILGVLGITITGIQYLTAGGSEEKTKKAERRMFEIILGLVAYVLIYAFLQWLLPGFKGLK